MDSTNGDSKENLATLAECDLVADEINLEHARSDTKRGEALSHVRRAGELLIGVKERLGHGPFTAWVADHCKFTDRTARLYMSLAKNWESLGAANRQHVSELSFRQALHSLKVLRENELELPNRYATKEEPPYRGDAYATIKLLFDNRRDADSFPHGKQIEPKARVIRVKTRQEAAKLAKLVRQPITPESWEVRYLPKADSFSFYFRAPSAELPEPRFDPGLTAYQLVNVVHEGATAWPDEVDLDPLIDALRTELQRVEELRKSRRSTQGPGNDEILVTERVRTDRPAQLEQRAELHEEVATA